MGLFSEIMMVKRKKKNIFYTMKLLYNAIRSFLSCGIFFVLIFLQSFIFLTVSITFAGDKLDVETWIELRKMVREKGHLPTIEEDIAALAGRDARRAGPRLIDRGPEVLPAVHAALLASDLRPEHGLRLLQVIGPLAEESSVPVLLDFLRRNQKNPLRRDTLYVLSGLPTTEDAAAYIVGLASNETEPWRIRSMAFTWFGMHRDPRGRSFAESLRNAVNAEHRALGLFVLARLSDKSALGAISEMLAVGPPANSRDVLMHALAELVGPEEFQRRAPSSLAWSSGYKDSLLYARYRVATAEQKPSICLEMLRSQMLGHLEIAVRCLLKMGREQDLRPFAAVDFEAPGRPALVRNEIRRAGWRVIDTDTEFRIEPYHSGSLRP